MANLFFVLGLGLAYAVLITWACRHLPGERWQIIASVPLYKNGGGQWHGLNLTYYGFFSATAYAVASAVMIIMLRSVNISVLAIVCFALPLLSVCAPASRLVARWVENKPATFTVGGASFVGLLLAPWLTLVVKNAFPGGDGPGLQVLPVMAALVAAYSIGEGLGRLACISFGCCYGKPMDQCPTWIQNLVGRKGFIFKGQTKKIAYESGWEGRPVFPIQAVTSLILVVCGLVCLLLFLMGLYNVAVWVGVTVTGGWRALSEVLRSDYRGGGALSAYQWMALASIPYGCLIPFIFPAVPASAPSLALGLESMWSAGMLLSLQALWLGVMLFMGRSKTTGSTISFHVVHSEI